MCGVQALSQQSQRAARARSRVTAFTPDGEVGPGLAQSDVEAELTMSTKSDVPWVYLCLKVQYAWPQAGARLALGLAHAWPANGAGERTAAPAPAPASGPELALAGARLS